MVEKIAVAVTGIGGRMGRALRDAIEDSERYVLAAAVERPGHDLVGREVDGVVVQDWLEGTPGDVDAIIDFSSPSAMVRYVEQAAAAGIPFVSGTTGLSDEDTAILERAAQSIPVLWAPNMSVGVHLLLRLVRSAALALGDAFDPEIFEIHHRFKVDAPSGTAVRIADVLREVRQSGFVFGRQGHAGPRPRNEIGVHALRGGDVVGEHTVVFAGMGERLELTHRAHSRATFAQGALRAAEFLQEKAPGRYDMADVLDAG